MISSSVQTVTNFAKAAIRLPYNLVRWFCGRIVSTVANISRFLTGSTGHNNEASISRTSLSDRNTSSSATNYERGIAGISEHKRMINIADLTSLLNRYKDQFASSELFDREKNRLLQIASRAQEEKGARHVYLNVKIEINSKGKKIEFELTPAIIPLNTYANSSSRSFKKSLPVEVGLSLFPDSKGSSSPLR